MYFQLQRKSTELWERVYYVENYAVPQKTHYNICIATIWFMTYIAKYLQLLHFAIHANDSVYKF